MKDINKKIYYFGEDRDYSDRWLIKALKNYFQVVLIKPNTNHKLEEGANYIVNRIYVSAYDRYDKKQIARWLSQLGKIKKTKWINSIEGLLLEYDRTKQYKFFISNRIPFVSTKSLVNIKNNKSITFPVVLKNNHSGRNKETEIINGYLDLKKNPSSIRKIKIAQQLIKNEICYRTEFIGDTLLTFPQRIFIKGNKLKFKYLPKVVKTPLSTKVIKKIENSLRKIGVQAFSIEYFIVKNNILIIDFNLSSNYKPFLIKQRGEIIKRAWLNLFR